MAAVRSLFFNFNYDNCITAFHNGVLANNDDITPRYPMWIISRIFSCGMP